MKKYLQLLQDVLDHGVIKGDRTGTGTQSLFGYQMQFDLEQGFPLVTTKRLHLRSIIHELLWFIRGDTNTRYLRENGVSIWDEWATEAGELGPVYGSQWRSWPTPDGGVIDQIDALVKGLRERPDSRRHIFSAWNPPLLPDESISPQANVAAGRMALAPCHAFVQFYVAGGKLSCMLTQRSADSFLGVPYNIASYAFLTHMVAQQCELEPGTLVWSGGDVHIYSNHFEQVKMQLGREPMELPHLTMARRPETLFDYRFEDFEIIGYAPHPPIPAPIAF